MTFYSFQELSKVLKKRYLLAIVIFIFSFSLCLYANKTFLSDKIDRKYSVSFDYEYHYKWLDVSAASVNYEKGIFEISCLHLEKVECMDFPYEELKDLIVGFFTAVYKHNKNDINPEKISYKENESYNDKNYDIALAFSYDDLNFLEFRNKKLHIGWSNVKEAEEYLQSLHDRAGADLINIIKLVADENNLRLKRYYGAKLLTFPATEVAQRIMDQLQLKNKLELDQFIEQSINKLKLNGINDSELFKLIFTDELFSPGSMDAFIFSSSLGSYEKIFSTLATKRDMIYYYLVNKYSSMEKIHDSDLDFYPSAYRLINNFKSYLPKYKIQVEKVNQHYIYLIEIFLALLITFIIIQTLSFKDKDN